MLLGSTVRVSAQISPGDLSREHQDLSGPLNCLKCHAGKSDAMDANCLACHAGIAQLKEKNLGLHSRTGKDRCATCHPEHAGRDFKLVAWEGGSPEKFDHGRTGWTLQGKHATKVCRDCHQAKYRTSPVTRVMKRKDLSGSWLGLETACASCHEDLHRGALGGDCARCHGFEAWKPAAAFDHAATAYPLTGKHATLECAKCHLAPGLDLARDGKGRPIPLYKPLRHDECSACHRDPHENRLGPACGKCHVTEGFKKTAAGGFDHGVTRYPLAGRHVGLECAKCHDPVKAWGKRPAFARCDDCHRDPHAGETRLAGKPADCAACHAVSGFRPSTYTVDRHREAAYPLEGKHRGVECRGCHLLKPAKVPAEKLGAAGILMRPRFATCRDCHAEAHDGQLTGRADGGACRTCHAPSGWKPSLFTVSDHATLKLALEGRHEEIACAACHGPRRRDLPVLPGPDTTGTAGVMLALGSGACVTCHVDPHFGRYDRPAEASPPGGCRACHAASTFRPATVGVETHREYSFPLEGAHRAVPCTGCHRELMRPPLSSTLVGAGVKLVPLRFNQHRSACRDCHDGPHGTQFAVRADKGACGTCHGVDAFAPADHFDHDRDTAFGLRGAHAKVACAECHPSRKDADGVERIRYRPTPTECESCHRGGRPGTGSRRNGGGGS